MGREHSDRRTHELQAVITGRQRGVPCSLLGQALGMFMVVPFHYLESWKGRLLVRGETGEVRRS